MKEITRESYIRRMWDWKDTQDIKVLSGVRRCGKSVILKQFSNVLKRKEPDSNIIYINLSDKSTLIEVEQNGLENMASTRYKEGSENYLLIDEVQMAKGFERDLNSLHSSGRFKLFVTGSNAFLMSSKLKTLFTGRTMEIPVFPFSFNEYCTYFDLDPYDVNSINGFLRNGGLPGSYQYNDFDSRMRYVGNVVDTVMQRDLLGNPSFDGIEEMESLFDFLADDIGNEISVRRIHEFLKNSGVSLESSTLESQLSAFKDSFLFYEVKPFDLRGSSIFKGRSKYYLSDVGFRTARMNTIFRDRGRLLENAVALELMRRGGRISVGKEGDKEIDFVISEDLGRRSYYQVCMDMTDQATFEREVSSLLDIRDDYPKFILTNTGSKSTEDFKGIKIVDMSCWLYGEEKVKDSEQDDEAQME